MKLYLSIYMGVVMLSVNEARKVELERVEGDAEQLDNKAEDAIFKFLVEKRRTESGGFEGDEFASSDIEWNGEVMLLNQSGPGQRPPKSLYDKLHHYNEMFKLGHVLRRCRSPDFLSEVTALQVHLINLSPIVLCLFSTTVVCDTSGEHT